MIGALLLLGCGNQPSAPIPIATAAEVVSGLDASPPLNSATSLPPTPTLNPAVVAEIDQTDSGAVPPALDVAPATPVNTPTPLPTPTATRILPPNELLEAGLRQIELANTELAADYFRQILNNPDSSSELIEVAKYNLGVALVADGIIDEARAVWIDYTQSTSVVDPAVWYRLAEIESDPATAEQYLLTFLQSHPELGPYVYPKLAKLNPAQAESYYLSGLNDVAWYRQTISVRRELADLYLEQERYAEAITQFEAIREAAFTDNTKGEMTWRIGETWALAGNNQAAVEAWQFGLNNFPTAYDSYLGLTRLVDLEVPVDDFQRGLVDYHAGVYGPAIDAFNNYLAANPENYRADTHLFLAWCYEQTGPI